MFNFNTTKFTSFVPYKPAAQAKPVVAPVKTAAKKYIIAPNCHCGCQIVTYILEYESFKNAVLRHTGQKYISDRDLCDFTDYELYWSLHKIYADGVHFSAYIKNCRTCLGIDYATIIDEQTKDAYDKVLSVP